MTHCDSTEILRDNGQKQYLPNDSCTMQGRPGEVKIRIEIYIDVVSLVPGFQ